MGHREANYASRSRLKRFSHGARFLGALRLLDLDETDVVLDYGGGDGHLISLAFEVQPKASYSVFEPATLEEARNNLESLPGVGLYSATAAMAPAMFSKICCLEVLEHVTPINTIPSVLRDIHRLLRPNGILIVSMPIEFGPISLFKNIFRVIHGTPFPGTNLKTILLSAIGLPSKVPRAEGHMGFDYRAILKLLLQAGFRLEETRFTPFVVAGPLCNSQVLYRLRS